MQYKSLKEIRDALIERGISVQPLVQLEFHKDDHDIDMFKVGNNGSGDN